MSEWAGGAGWGGVQWGCHAFVTYVRQMRAEVAVGLFLGAWLMHQRRAYREGGAGRSGLFIGGRHARQVRRRRCRCVVLSGVCGKRRDGAVTATTGQKWSGDRTDARGFWKDTADGRVRCREGGEGMPSSGVVGCGDEDGWKWRGRKEEEEKEQGCVRG